MSLRVFDRSRKLIQRAAAARNPSSNMAEYLRDEVSRRAIERLAFLKTPLENMLDFGSNSGNFAKLLADPSKDDNEQWKIDRLQVRNKISHIDMLDSSEAMLYKNAELPFNKELSISRIVQDEETFEADKKYDLIVSNLSMHWINDLPNVYSKLFKALKPDGCFMGVMFGGDTLFELRTSLQLAEIERYGGLAPRVSPFVGSADVGNLMQKAGFQMLTVDVQELVVEYPNILALMEDLQMMGENNSLVTPPPSLTKDLLIAAEPIYRELHGDKATGHLPATFRLVNMIGWRPGKYLAKPAPRGSGDVSLKDALDGTITMTSTLKEDK